MMAKLMKTLQSHYPMIQFLIMSHIQEVRPDPFRSPQQGIGGKEDLQRVVVGEDFGIFCQAVTK